MKYEEIKSKTPDELNKILVDLTKKRYNISLLLANGETKKTSEIRSFRKTVARIKTYLNLNKKDA